MPSQTAVHPDGQAEVQLPCTVLGPCLEFFVGQLGFRIEAIFPAEEPKIASLSGYGLRIRLAPGDGAPGHIRLARENPGPPEERVLFAPNGTKVELVEPDPPIDIPPFAPEFILTRQADGPSEGAGRAGMIYRDLIPGRLGGRYIASHISLPKGGPVGDWVHFHKIRFQMIFCRQGWARLVYEDQGEPFVMSAGDCVLQPPRIRHRVLESSPLFEVVEIGCPALHETLADHDMHLPTNHFRPDRDFGGQIFLHHIAAKAAWTPHGETGFERRDTGMAEATRGIADAYVLRPAGGTRLVSPAHNGELLFGFMLAGSGVLDHDGDHPLGPADAFVIPPSADWALKDVSGDLDLLQVVCPAA